MLSFGKSYIGQAIRGSLASPCPLSDSQFYLDPFTIHVHCHVGVSYSSVSLPSISCTSIGTRIMLFPCKAKVRKSLKGYLRACLFSPLPWCYLGSKIQTLFGEKPFISVSCPHRIPSFPLFQWKFFYLGKSGDSPLKLTFVYYLLYT